MTNKEQDKKTENGLKKFFKAYSIKQKIWFYIGAIFFLLGLAFLITSIVGDCLNVAPSKNPILIADSALKTGLKTPLGFLYWGLILFILGALIISITLSLASKNEDRDKERQARRDQRLKQMMSASNEDAVVQSSVNDSLNVVKSETPVASTIGAEPKPTESTINEEPKK